MSTLLRTPFEGTKRLVVAIDIGTTYTAASFCILKPGLIPKFEEILSWPKQVVADAKVPSVIYYDVDGEACAFGAETEDEDRIFEAEENAWVKAEWWKLYLRPDHLPLIRGLELPELPPNTTVDDIFEDFLRFVKLQIQLCIQKSYADGLKLWNTLYPSMVVVLTTPNGWEGIQQDRMRRAAIQAELVDADGGRRVRFVTEAEAAVLYAANTGSVEDWLVDGGNIILCDCGGGTIDITAYTIRQTNPLRLEESSAPQCYLAGGVHVSNEAKTYFSGRLVGTEWDNVDAIRRITDNFDRGAKKAFCDPSKPSYIQLDGHKNDAALGIVRGRMKVSGEDIASFFRPSIDGIINGLNHAWENGNRLADKVIIVGGLAGSPYVYDEILRWGARVGVSISRPDGPSTKAVANGALAWHLDCSVSARVARYDYGIEIGGLYDANVPEMADRKRIRDPYDGLEYVHHLWSCIVSKDAKIKGKKEFSSSYWRPIGMEDKMEFSQPILAFRKLNAPKFIYFDDGYRLLPGFEILCSVEFNLQRAWDAAPVQISKINGAIYKDVWFTIHLTLVDTEVTARASWLENGVVVYSPAVITYD
ncbi:hypothetical protein HGRIS_010962 [Hohenbuehelia grisea]|uniref:Uncharacterized protein n=1 Tax=Hohenbuehelia grisea TaxID=104357 RepID=A0ABR3IYD2_9AGAR